ncbi:MAG TPA: YetF domain-containing protein [Tepidisphaeraceae bacterium]|nr:YetF domain-containing protein [Tepidisphaeraceae bacterium]
MHWHDAMQHMFGLGLPVIEKILRAFIVYFFLLLGLRLAGKRELAQLNPFDLIVLLLLSNTVQNAIIGDDNTVTGGMIGAAALLVINYVMVRLVRGNRKLQRLLEGRADILIRNGQLQKDHLNRELISRAELVAAAHKQGISSLNEVQECVLEPTGTISFIQKRPTPEGGRHEELMTMLNKLSEDLAALKSAAKTVS